MTPLIEQYKVYVDVVERLTQRKEQIHRFNVVIVSGLVAFIFAVVKLEVPVGVQHWMIWLAIYLGSLSSVLWLGRVMWYGNEIDLRLKAIQQMEQQLPIQLLAFRGPRGGSWLAKIDVLMPTMVGMVFTIGLIVFVFVTKWE